MPSGSGQVADSYDGMRLGGCGSLGQSAILDGNWRKLQLTYQLPRVLGIKAIQFVLVLF